MRNRIFAAATALASLGMLGGFTVPAATATPTATVHWYAPVGR